MILSPSLIQVHLLWWSSIRHRFTALRAHPCWHHQGHRHPLCPSEWLPRGPTIRLGLPRLACGKRPEAATTSMRDLSPAWLTRLLGFSQEYEIDKTLGIKGPDDVAKMGIAEYNKQCRGIVMRYSKEWEVRVFQMSSILGTHLKLCLLMKFDCSCVVELLKLQWITLKWCSSCFSVFGEVLKKNDLI